MVDMASRWSELLHLNDHRDHVLYLHNTERILIVSVKIGVIYNSCPIGESDRFKGPHSILSRLPATPAVCVCV